MDRLILFRHGRAEAESDSGDDFDRRLAPCGQAESESTGRRLAEMGHSPDLALVSPAARTRETWAAMQQHFPDARADFDNDLYAADSEAVREAARQAAGPAATVMVVGHNPGMQELAVRLLIEAKAPPDLIAKARRGFPTAAAAVFRMEGATASVFEALVFPEPQP